MTTLADFYSEARVKVMPEWAASIILTHPDYDDYKPRWHQILGLNLSMIHTRAALYDEQGTGKTLPGQAWALWHAAMGNGVVFLMPPVLIPQFEEAFYLTFKGIEKYIKIERYNGSPKERNAQATAWLQQKPQIVLMTPDIFRKESALFKQLDMLALGCDECKYWANPDSKIYNVIEQFIGPMGERALLGMNGTPAKNDLSDLYGYIRLVTPGVYVNKLDFYSKHINLKTVKSRYKKEGRLVERDVEIIDSFRNLPILRMNTMLQARRVEKKDVLDLPPMQIIDFPVELSKKHYDRYRQFAVAKVIEFEDGTAISGEQTSTMRQICMQSVINTDILQVNEESVVLEAIEELLDQIDVMKNKVYIGAYYNRSIEIICERFKHLKPAMIYGPNAGKNAKEIERFKKDPSCRLGVANYESGGVGLNLQDICHYAIAAEPITVPGSFDQWTGRIDRSGQKHKVTIYSIVVRGTAWVKAQQAMLKKAVWNSGVVSSTELRKELLGEN